MNLDMPFVFSSEWFELHQDRLLRFANSRAGRRILRIHGNRSSVGDNRITKITPSSISWDDKTEFRTHNKYAERLYYGLKPLWFVLHGWDMTLPKVAPVLNAGFDTLTVYPAAGANSPVDGYVARGLVSETFATIHDGAGNSFSDTSEDLYAYLEASSTSNQYADLERSIICWDTSALGASVEISSAIISLWDRGVKNIGLGNDNIHICASTPASTSSLAASDYANLGTTSFASLDVASHTSNAYNDFTLNASGLANISKTGISKFGVRLGWDLNNSFTGVWAANDATFILYGAADIAGTTNDPTLVVTYSAPTTSTSSSTSTSLSTSSTSTSISTSSTSLSTSSSTSTSISFTTSTSSTSISTSSTSASSSTSTTLIDVNVIPRATIRNSPMRFRIINRRVYAVTGS